MLLYLLFDYMLLFLFDYTLLDIFISLHVAVVLYTFC